MNMIADLFKALKYGEELKDPARWKKGQLSITAIGGLIIIAMRFIAPDYDMPEEMVNTISEAVGAVLIAANLFITKASSKKV
jgi:hypothetical protein